MTEKELEERLKEEGGLTADQLIGYCLLAVAILTGIFLVVSFMQ